MNESADKKTTVLVIDDEIQIRRLLRVCLERNGYNAVEAATGVNCWCMSPPIHTGPSLEAPDGAFPHDPRSWSRPGPGCTTHGVQPTTPYQRRETSRAFLPQ